MLNRDSIQHSTLSTRHLIGQVSEWSKEHDWKSCRCNSLEGSNPSLSGQGQHSGPDSRGMFLESGPANWPFLLVALRGEIAVPCICNPLSRTEFLCPGPRLWGCARNDSLISGPRATAPCEPRQGRKAATVSNRRRAPRVFCFEFSFRVSARKRVVKARVRDLFFRKPNRPRRNVAGGFVHRIPNRA